MGLVAPTNKVCIGVAHVLSPLPSLLTVFLRNKGFFACPATS
jgi:hypothetical protein